MFTKQYYFCETVHAHHSKMSRASHDVGLAPVSTGSWVRMKMLTFIIFPIITTTNIAIVKKTNFLHERFDHVY